MEQNLGNFTRIGRLILCGIALAIGLSSSSRATSENSVLAESVYVVEARGADGSGWRGSAVAIAPDMFVTNCHVTRGAATLDVAQGGNRRRAVLRGGSSDLDLCVLAVSGAGARSSRFRDASSLAVGETVYAVGYPSGQSLSVRSGVVKALHRHENSNVIQASATFEPGSSGGALFDRNGNLVGILTFKMLAGDDFHFAVPADWLSRAVSDTSGVQGAPAFWERRNALPQSLAQIVQKASVVGAGSR